MKILLVLVALLVAGVAGAAGAALFAPSTANSAAAHAVEPARAPAESTGISAAVDQRIQALSMEVAELQAQIRELKSSAARTAVVAVEAAPVTSASAAPVAAVQRDQILQVMADAKADEERRREEERSRREEEQRLQRADRMAQRFGLNEGQERQLADFYSVSRAKLDEMRESMSLARESGSFDGEAMRTAMRDTRDWANAELERLFGPDVGKQIAETEMDRFRGGGFGGGPDGNRAARRSENDGNATGPGGTSGG